MATVMGFNVVKRTDISIWATLLSLGFSVFFATANLGGMVGYLQDKCDELGLCGNWQRTNATLISVSYKNYAQSKNMRDISRKNCVASNVTYSYQVSQKNFKGHAVYLGPEPCEGFPKPGLRVGMVLPVNYKADSAEDSVLHREIYDKLYFFDSVFWLAFSIFIFVIALRVNFNFSKSEKEELRNIF